MTNRDLLNIIEEIKRKEKTDLTEIASAVGKDRSYLSKLINSEQTKQLTKPLLRDFAKAFPAYFKADNKNNVQHPTAALTGAKVTLQDYIDELRNDKATLYALANSILDQIKLDTKTALAYQMAWVEYEAERAAKGDEQLKIELIHKMNTLVRSYLPGRTVDHSETGTGKKSKG